ncbi:hypothetical protein CCH79_00008330 [Gambusia affinis]|uniref:TNFR-Cys domain-containing protein n=1 Tax=Gambusia affinis TaxID=33528 RepID=A0A315V475_GAMAF|nr:hypothetical protein CCH79_00008330 [Gambusia affinis]
MPLCLLQVTQLADLSVKLATIALASKTERALNVECDSGQFTTGGECCMECPPGEGVVKECGAAQTVCAQCLDSETYSENYSHTETCKPCTQCTGLMRMETPCTDSNDAKCVCKYNFYFNSVSGRCEPCTVCPLGQGVYSHCDAYHDTVCEECVDETFSDRESYLEPCLPCTICEEDIETQMAECTPISDSVCHTMCFQMLLSGFGSTSLKMNQAVSKCQLHKAATEMEEEKGAGTKTDGELQHVLCWCSTVNGVDMSPGISSARAQVSLSDL